MKNVIELLVASAEYVVFPRKVISWANLALIDDIVGHARDLKDEEVGRFYELSSQGAT